MPDRQQLTDLQTDVLRLLWEQGELTVAQIWEQLYADRKLAQTTVATIVARLQRRGILSRRTPWSASSRSDSLAATSPSS